MEADEYFSTYDALHQEGVPPRRLQIREKYPSGVKKIVWSSFDFMTGPELRFVWEVSASSASPTGLSSGEEGSVNDVESLDSSLSTQSAQFEDIDDPLEAELTTTTDLFDSMLLSDSAYGYFTSSPLRDYGSGPCLADFMTESRSTTTLTSSTLDMNESHLTSEAGNSRIFSPPIVEETGVTDEMGNFISEPSESHSQSRTPHIDSIDLSSLLTADLASPRDTSTTKKDPLHDSGSDTLTDGSSFAKLPDTEISPKSEDSRKGNEQVLTTSCVDSGIAGTVSMHSDLSALCQSPIRPTTSSYNTNTSPKFYGDCTEDAEDVTSVLDMSLEAPDESITDEQFVSKFVLAEQICTTQLPSNPLMMKMTIVPTRKLLACSYIFSGETKNGRKTIHAITFLMSNSRTNWFMKRQNFFETVVTDAVPRLKASIYAETFDDVIVRATSELTRFMELLGCLERYPLVSEDRPLMIKHTLFASRRCQDDKILPKVISGILQSQGYCVVVGSDQQYVAKLLYTLAMFLPEELRWCGLRTYRHSYSPYVRLQAIRRTELPHVIRFGVMSSWPICVVDVDQSTVCMSAPYSRHRAIRQKAELQRVEALLDLPTSRERSPKLELSNCRMLECVRKFLKHMDLLPFEESTRAGFISQLLLYVENMAHAFIRYVKETSEPDSSEKSNPLKSSRFSLSDVRKALDLQSDAWFHAILAHAELIEPDVADFLYS